MPLIKPVSVGVELPELNNPAAAENIQTGFEAIDGSGGVITGTHVEAEIPALPTLNNPAVSGDILNGKEAINGDGNKMVGGMVNNGAVSATINAGGAYTIPAGYHNGGGKVTGNSLASQTAANAAAADIVSGKTAWVNGVKVTGTYVEALTIEGNSYKYATPFRVRFDFTSTAKTQNYPNIFPGAFVGFSGSMFCYGLMSSGNNASDTAGFEFTTSATKKPYPKPIINGSTKTCTVQINVNADGSITLEKASDSHGWASGTYCTVDITIYSI